MKIKIFLCTYVCLASFSFLQAQTTISIRLSPSTGQDAYVTDYFPNTNFRVDPDLVGWAWTQSGTPLLGRTFFKFDLSFIPPNSLITSARLSLYGNPSPARGPGHSTWSGSNASYLKKVVTNWNDSTITWNNQAATTSVNQVSLPASSFSMQDYPNIDVTTLVRDMIANPSSNYGLIIQLQTEQYYRCMNFASGDCSDSTKRPKLEITYTLVGINPISSETPDNFYLFQNYPNPFNPSTKLKFDIPSSGLSEKGTGVILLKIFDALGRELTTLVNESLSAGMYEIEWDASKYPSGAYYYTLTAGEHMETRRMILLK